ncbi:MAG TPA: nucleotidyltransferase family protein [Phycisphaerales bacterium]|nr:nucleotidyltransferase family protein [Phycisphaerales bacterium]
MAAHQLADGVMVDRDQLAALCRRHGIAVIRVFGSALRADFGADSDIDILVEFEPGVDPDLFALGGIQQDLSDLFGREVDLKTPEMFSPATLEHVLRSSRLGYAA